MSEVVVTMPKMGATMTEGTVAVWRVAPGQSVAIGDVLCEIETDKASVDVESEHTGTVAALLVREGETVAIGVPIARLST